MPSRTKTRTLPPWARRARSLRREYQGGLTQEEFARHLGVSTSEVRRWEQGRRAPTPVQAIALGKLAGAPECWYWWGLAGLAEADVYLAVSTSNSAAERLQRRRRARIGQDTRALLITALETILERAPSVVIEEIARILTDRAGKYAEPHTAPLKGS